MHRPQSVFDLRTCRKPTQRNIAARLMLKVMTTG
jgi:hypothetical protein